MRYEVLSDGHLQVVVQSGHELWNLFRQAYESAVNFNLQEKGESPTTIVLKELFPKDSGQIEEYMRVYFPRTPENFPSDIEPYSRNLKVWKTKADFYTACTLIAEYLHGRFMDAHERLGNKDSELSERDLKRWGELQTARYNVSFSDENYETKVRTIDEQADEVWERREARSKRVSQTLNRILQRARLTKDCDILFGGADGIEPYHFKSREKPSPHDPILFNTGSGPIIFTI